ncbi:glucose-1-phosphate thymidylyltransferase [Micromonospora pisi]|uniref:Glucose-1-phosphate thymidylyltransferase n=1 Tax=Micromonospora pisi TaxID=589240 RepID=A0A495JDI1_9ACTN|nr:glucose-1-phosphate thymidylyltransferase [Micromonospora pisi]RKR86893.1 glucose-1-phosphate thymidylyltransferase [Micromonospora pisi]
MKALVLSGGSGTRLRPLSYSLPKQLLPIANRPILEYALDAIQRLGVTEIGIVIGTPDSEIPASIGDGSRWDTPITYIHQDRPGGLAHAVRTAQPFLGSDDFVMYLGDNVMPSGLEQIATEFGRWRPSAQLAAHKVPDPGNFGVVELDEKRRVVRLVEKPSDPRSDLALIGVYFFTPAIHEAIASIRPSARGELEITDAVQWLLEQGRTVRVVEYDGYWKDAGQPDDLLECNRRLLSDLSSDIAGTVDAASRIGPQVVIEAGARIERSRVEGPAIIGTGTVIEDSHIGPYTAIGRDCVLRRSRVADSILLDRVSVVQVSALYGSLIGRRASIVGGTGAEAGHRLLVGDDAAIEVAA